MNQKGFSQLILLVIVGVIVVAAGGSIWYYRQPTEQNNKSAPETQAIPEQTKQQAPTVSEPATTQLPPPSATPKPASPQASPAPKPSPAPTEQPKQQVEKQEAVPAASQIAQKLAAHQMPQLLDIEFESGVDKDDEAGMREGFKTIDFYLNEWFGHSITKKTSIRVEAVNKDSKWAEENGTVVFVFRTLSRDWQIPKQNEGPFQANWRSRVAAHEYVHLYQMNNGGCAHIGRIAENPKWFVEGAADWLSYKAVNGSWSFPFWFKFAVPQMGGLKSIQTYDEAQDAEKLYPYFASAVDFLMKNKDIKTLDAFCINLGRGQEVSAAFQNAFGVPLEQFYSDFKAYFTKTFSIPVE